MVVELTLRALTNADQFFGEVNLRTSRRDYAISIDRIKSGGKVHTFFSKVPKPPKPDKCGFVGYGVTALSCKGLTAAADAPANVLRVTLPRACLGNPEWVRGGAFISGNKEPYASDTWGRQADRPKNNYLVNPLGPRVRADAP